VASAKQLENLAKAREAKARKRAENGGEKPQPSPGKPPQLVDLGIPPRAGLNPVGREIKMLRPTCAVCEAPERKTARWWVDCIHDPYIIQAEIPRIDRKVETVEGERVVTARTEKLLYEEYPSMRQVQHTSRVNLARQIDRERALGSIMPEEFRGEFRGQQIEGFAPFCQYRDCWCQKITVRSGHGDYCRVDQAKLIAIEERGSVDGRKRLEVQDEQKRFGQLENVKL
jgi:hypothetical protein